MKCLFQKLNFLCKSMILCIDAYYFNNKAKVSGGLFQSWTDSAFCKVYNCDCDDVLPYEPGSFYQRELPCLKKLIYKISEPIEVIIIDGYVTLGSDMKKGLGAHLYEELNQRIPVIGVAKSKFKDTPEECFVFRGQSLSPLYITCLGIPLEMAKKYINSMVGEYRIPLLLKEIDKISRSI